MPKFQGIDDYCCRLLLVCLTHYWLWKLRDEISYPGLAYLPQWLQSELTFFIGILIVLRCMSMVKWRLIKYFVSIAMYTVLDWISSHENGKKAMLPCYAIQILLIILNTYPMDRLRTQYNSVLSTSAFFVGLKSLEFIKYKLFFTDHVFLIYLTVIMVPERLYPKLTLLEMERLKSVNHFAVLHERLNISIAYPMFTAYWFYLQLLKLAKFGWYGDFWFQMFDQGFRSPFEAFIMVCFVCVVTDRLLDWAVVKVLPTRKPWSSTPFPLMLSCQLFAFALDDGIWNMDRDKQWDQIKLILLILVVNILFLVERWWREFLVEEAQLYNYSWKEKKMVAFITKLLAIYAISAYIIYKLWAVEWKNSRAFYVLLFLTEVGIKVILLILQWIFAARLSFNHSKIFHDTLFGYILIIFGIIISVIRVILTVWIMMTQFGGIFRIREIVTDALIIYYDDKKLKEDLRTFRSKCEFVQGLNRVERNALPENADCTICMSTISVVACETGCHHYFHVMCFEGFMIKTTTDNPPCPVCRTLLR